MELQESDAREIVSELAKLLGTKLNIMNSRGFIIASSDESRIGTFHAGAYEIIEKNLDSLEISDSGNWQGTAPGQNFPIRVGDRIVGVVGITGEADATRKYGSIIRKMTEILVKGKSREEEEHNRQTEISRFLADWISDGSLRISNTLIQRGKELGISVTRPHRIAALYISPLSEFTGIIEKSVKAAVLQYFPATLFYNSSNCLIAVLQNFSDSQIKKRMEEIITKAGKKGIALYMGISPAEESGTCLNIHRNYLQARKALAVSREQNVSNSTFYSDLGIELVSDTIPLQNKQEFLEKILAGISPEKKDETVQMLKVFYEQNGSLKTAADKLGIHPNTLQYHLNRIKVITGYDPRTYKDAMLFQMALLFYLEPGNR